MVRLTINGKTQDVDVDPNTPLLWAIREQLGLTGTKYGCGVAQCGACTVHIDGAPIALLPRCRSARRRPEDHHHRRPRLRQDAAQSAEGLDRPRGAAVRLLPVRHDHGRRGAARGRSRSPPTRTSTPRSPTSAAAARSRKCARRSTPPPRHKEAAMKMNRRSFIVSSAAVTGGLALGFDPSVRNQSRARAGRLAGAHRLGRDPAQRHRRHPHGALRDGPGHDHRPGAAGRRGAGVRLEQGHLRIPDARHEPQAQARLGRLLHRRQPRHPHLARATCARAARPRA